MNNLLILTRPLCFLDIESTGTDAANDRIIELAMLGKDFAPDTKAICNQLLNSI